MGSLWKKREGIFKSDKETARKKSELLGALEELFNEYMKTRGGIMCAVIYGSYALGEFTEGSDVDLLLVTEDGEGMETCHELHNGRNIEVTMVGAKLFDEMVKEANPFIVGALIHGIPIYGKENIEKH